MLRDHAHRIVDEVFDLRRTILSDEHAAQACRHVRGAHREMLLAFRALIDGALARLDDKHCGSPLVRVDVEGE